MLKTLNFILFVPVFIRCVDAAQLLPKNGVCPAGYANSGDFCKPTKNARFAVEKHGGCPAGYSSSGDYCLAGKSARLAVVKSGVCPAGWVASGSYCLSRP